MKQCCLLSLCVIEKLLKAVGEVLDLCHNSCRSILQIFTLMHLAEAFTQRNMLFFPAVYFISLVFL